MIVLVSICAGDVLDVLVGMHSHLMRQLVLVLFLFAVLRVLFGKGNVGEVLPICVKDANKLDVVIR